MTGLPLAWLLPGIPVIDIIHRNPLIVFTNSYNACQVY
jgi:hypothetical protein